MGVTEELTLSLGMWVLVSYLCSSRQVIPMLLGVLIRLNGLKEIMLQETVESRRLEGRCGVGPLKKVQEETNGYI